MVIAKLILTSIVTMLPKGLAFGMKLIKLKKMSDAIAKNPKATNGGGMTVIASSLVALLVAFAEMKGIEIPADMQSALIGVVSAVGLAYTVWRAKR
jgi:hypothetical protein